jgi:hypothetical protein
MLTAPGTLPTLTSVHTPAQATVDALRRQLHMTPEPLRPDRLPLQRDVRWIADAVLEKLVLLPGYHRDQCALEALHHTLTNSAPRLEVSAEELADVYVFFKKAEHLLDRHRSRQNPQIEADHALCRALKWQFRAAVSEGKHQRLTQRLLPSIDYIRAGGERINHRHIGYNVALEPTQQISAGPQLTADSHLAITGDQHVKHTRVIALQGTLKSTLATMTQAQTHQHISLGHVSSRTYANLEHYADARSHSVLTALSESLRGTIQHLGSLVSDHHHLPRHRAYSALSQPAVREALANIGLPDVELPCLQNTPAPVMTETGIVFTARSTVAADFFSFLKLNTAMSLTLQRTHQHKALDILALHETAPAMALQQLAALPHPGDTPALLLNDMQAHVTSNSRQFTQQASACARASELNASLHASNRQARSLLERYVRLQTQSRLDPDVDKRLREFIHQNRALLRPEALKVYTLTAQAQTLSGYAAATASSQADGGKGVTITYSHRKRDDPHLSGDYLEIDIAALTSMYVAKGILRSALSALGDQTFDWENLIRSISESLLSPTKPASTHVLVKIKHGEPVVLFTRHTVEKSRNLALPEKLEQYSGVQAQSLRTRHTVLKEQLGTESLDHLLPLARRYLHAPEQRSGWDDYVQRHANAFTALLDTIARQAHGTVLSAELDTLKRTSPILAQAVETLTQHAQTALQAPTVENRIQAREAFDHLLVAYLPHYEATVSKAWTLS